MAFFLREGFDIDQEVKPKRRSAMKNEISVPEGIEIFNGIQKNPKR